MLSRAALLDIFLLFFVLAAFGALVLDRDARRRRWARALDDGLDPSQPGRAGRPPTGWRTWPWWRLAAGVLIGCACAVKWSALYFVPAFALLVLFWEVGVRRSAGVRRPWRDTLARRAALAGARRRAHGRAPTSPPGRAGCSPTTATTGSRRPTRAARLSDRPVIGPLINLFEYHRAAYGFHAQLDDAHKYQSWPWQWLLLGRPVAFH